MKPKVDTELKRLEREGILYKVKFSNWATPIVPVVKPSATVRICGDYKGTVNPQLETEEYPLPRIDGIFTKLAGEQRFTKIDLGQLTPIKGCTDTNTLYSESLQHQQFGRGQPIES